MAIDLVPGVSFSERTHFISTDPAVTALQTPPFTILTRVKLNSAPGSGGATIIFSDAAPSSLSAVRLGITDAGLALAGSADLGYGTSYSLTPLSVGVWYNIVGVWRSNVYRQVWLNGVAGVADTLLKNPINLDRVFIGATKVGGGYNQQLTACIQDIAIWRRELSEAEIISLNTLIDVSSLHNIDVFFHVPFVDEPTKLDASDYTSGVPVAVSLSQSGSSGSVTTCVDSPEFPEEPEPTDCEGEDVADEVPAVTFTWPKCDLVPEDIDVQAVSETSTPGRSLGGRQQFMQRAAGHWRFELIGIPVWTEQLVRRWHSLESKIDGRNGTVLVPFYAAKLSGTPIAAVSANDYPVGEVRIGIVQTAGATIRAGMEFSADERGYRVKRVLGTDGGVTSVIIWPPLRDAIESADALDFNDPHCRCRLERDDGMAIMLEHLKFGKHTVALVEDV